MPDPCARRGLRIGIDVGGTNTDGVIIDPLQSSSPEKGILAWHKAPTTSNPSGGIRDAIMAMIQTSQIALEEVICVTIGTTHFVNAVVERDASRLSRVAVIRLCGPFSKHTPPCLDWPKDLKQIILGHYALLNGGLEVDGTLISEIDEKQIKEQCDIIREKGLKTIVINGVFSPIDTIQRQEERAAGIFRAMLPDCSIVCSSEVANLGFLERENAAILNASILEFAKKSIRSFQEPIRRLGLHCPIFITQNDGTVLPGDMAEKLPIRTFASGPTNSMRGAAYLSQGELSESVMVVDIGGTTTDVGLLHANGFPRQQAVYSYLAGIRMNLSCPDIKSIGLGGGSVVRLETDSLTIGPESVGLKLTEDSILFGGKRLTTTDCMLQLRPDLDIGNPLLVENLLTSRQLGIFQKIVRDKLEQIIDTMKSAPDDLPVFLVGGGAVLAPDILKGATRVLKPKWSHVANAIGAAMARVSAVIDTVRSTESKSESQILEEVGKEAIEKTIAAGASRESIEVVEQETLPLQYIANKTRFIVRAAGDFDFSTVLISPKSCATTFSTDETTYLTGKDIKGEFELSRTPEPDLDVLSYKPRVKNRVWYISETDVEWIATGCYILGTGGGGSPYSHKILLREKMRNGAIVRVVSPDDLRDDDQVACGYGVGSPTVGIEKLPADELLEAQRELFKICPLPATHMMSIEIGGANGLQAMILGASTVMDLPAVDGDWMGRAYPTKWQTTPVVFNERTPIWSPTAMSDGNGNVVVMAKATSDHAVERVMRAALTTMGSSTGCADPPVTGAETKRWAVEHTLSQAWRIGRGVARARQESQLDNVAETIINECGGLNSGKVLWKGKIVGVERTLRDGHVYGECIIQGLDSRNGNYSNYDCKKGQIKIPFKNENIAALRMRDDGMKEQQEDVLAIVPDLITVIDAQSGEAIGTPEYRYGLLVVVLGLAASDKWTRTERGIKLGGPESFGFNYLEYQPLGEFSSPRSVIDEFDVAA